MSLSTWVPRSVPGWTTVCLCVFGRVTLRLCVSVCLSVRTYVYLSVFLSVRTSVCLSVNIFCLSVCLSTCPPACLSVRAYVYQYFCLPMCLSVRLSICPPVSLSDICLTKSLRVRVRLLVCVSVCLSISPSGCSFGCLFVSVSVYLYVCVCPYFSWLSISPSDYPFFPSPFNPSLLPRIRPPIQDDGSPYHRRRRIPLRSYWAGGRAPWQPQSLNKDPLKASQPHTPICLIYIFMQIHIHAHVYISIYKIYTKYI